MFSPLKHGILVISLEKAVILEEMMITVVGIGPEGLKREQQFDDITKLGSLEQCT